MFVSATRTTRTTTHASPPSSFLTAVPKVLTPRRPRSPLQRDPYTFPYASSALAKPRRNFVQSWTYPFALTHFSFWNVIDMAGNHYLRPNSTPMSSEKSSLAIAPCYITFSGSLQRSSLCCTFVLASYWLEWIFFILCLCVLVPEWVAVFRHRFFVLHTVP